MFDFAFYPNDLLSLRGAVSVMVAADGRAGSMEWAGRQLTFLSAISGCISARQNEPPPGSNRLANVVARASRSFCSVSRHNLVAPSQRSVRIGSN